MIRNHLKTCVAKFKTIKRVFRVCMKPLEADQWVVSLVDLTLAQQLQETHKINKASMKICNSLA